MPAAATGPAAPDSFEALKRVKAAETEWDAKLTAARSGFAAELERQRDDSDAAIKAAQVAADRTRAQAVQKARDAAEREAMQIVADGKRAAEQAASGAGKRPADRKDEILAVVLAAFAGD